MACKDQNQLKERHRFVSSFGALDFSELPLVTNEQMSSCSREEEDKEEMKSWLTFVHCIN